MFLENLFLPLGESLLLLFLVGDFEGERRDEVRECEARCNGLVSCLDAESSGCFLGEVELLLKKLGRTISNSSVCSGMTARVGVSLRVECLRQAH